MIICTLIQTYSLKRIICISLRSGLDAAASFNSETGRWLLSEKREVLLRGVGTLRYCLILSEISACQVPICAVAAWWFNNPHQKVVPGSQIPRNTSLLSNLDWGAHRPRHDALCNLVLGMLRPCLRAQIRSRIVSTQRPEDGSWLRSTCPRHDALCNLC